ncbi:MAG: helix-turn-helix domain-containing protein [Phycisphaeraceae bacterium]|nr:helix-turn-helix domain-containing protein [Phycisphaeraceae bacterium]
MQSHLSPKDLALLIGVSESSLKRWVDDGRLRAERTAGGHRRIAMAEAVRFIRETSAPIADPALFSLPELDQAAVDAAQNGEAELAILSAARDRNTARATGVLIAEFLRSRTVASVCDGPMTMLLNQAEQDGHGAAASGSNVHPGTAAAICKETTHRISVLLAEPRADGPVAVVSAVGSEGAGARALMAGAVLRECNYRVVGAELASGNGQAGRESLVCTVFDRGATLPADQRRHSTDAGVETVWFGPGIAGLPPRTGVRIVHSLCELACVARAARPASVRDMTTVKTTRLRATT